MDEYLTEGKIIMTYPDATSGSYEDGDRTITQHVIFELKNGMQLELFDSNMFIARDMEGKNKKIEISVPDSENGVLDSKPPEKLIREETPKPEFRHCGKFYFIQGVVVHKTIHENCAEDECVIDFGTGYAHFSAVRGKFKAGDFVYIRPTRLDVCIPRYLRE